MFGKPDPEKVLAKFAHQVSPIPTAVHLLSFIGDKRVLLPFPPGLEPPWRKVVAVLLIYNPHISVEDVVRELEESRDIYRT